MKKRFVTITADNHPDWTAEDWQDTWANVLKKIDTTKDDIFISGNVRFTNWGTWMGLDKPDHMREMGKVLIIEKEHEINPNIYSHASKCPICKEDRKIAKNLCSYGLSEKNFIVRDGKVFMNNPVLDSLIGNKP